MPLTLSKIPTGPAIVTAGAYKHQALDDCSIAIGAVTAPVVTSLDGEIGQTITRHDITASYTPDGRWTADMRAALYPYASHRRGQVCTPAAWRFDALDGQIHTILAGVLTQMPEMTFAVDKPIFGPVNVTGLCVGTLDPADAASYYTPTMTGSNYTDAAFDPAELVRGNFRLTFGSLLTTIEAQDGWKVTPTLTQETIYVAGVQRRMTVSSVGCMVTGIPTEFEADDLFDALKVQNGAGVVPGRSTRVDAAALTIALGATTYFYAAKATLVSGGFAFGAQPLRVGEIGFVLSRDFTLGEPSPLFQFTTPTP